MVCGGLGSGKTLFTTIYAKFFKGKIVSNYTLHSIDYDKFSINTFIEGNYEDCLILMDEAYQYVDSRASMSTENRLFSYVLFQSRKKNVEIFLTAQLTSSLDLRFRELADFIVDCEQIKEGFQYILHNTSKPNQQAISILPYNKAFDFFKLYDTNEIVMDKPKTMRFATDNERFQYADKYGKALRQAYNRAYKKKHPKSRTEKDPSKNWADIWMLKKNIPKDIRNLVYKFAKSGIK